MTAATPSLRSLQLILAALAFGILVFTCITVGLRLAGQLPANPRAAELVSVVLVLVAVAELPVYLLLRRVLLGRVRAERDQARELLSQGHVPPPVQALAIVGAALAEGFGLLGVVALLLGGPWYLLGAPVLAIALILVQLPTRERLEHLVRASV